MDPLFFEAKKAIEANEADSPLGKLDTLRSLADSEKFVIMKKYVVEGQFCLLKWLEDQKTENKEIYLLARRTLPHFSASAVSENTFSTHSIIASKLRKKLGGEHMCMIIKANRNHDLLYDRIKGQIKKRYVSKFGYVMPDPDGDEFETESSDGDWSDAERLDSP